MTIPLVTADHYEPQDGVCLKCGYRFRLSLSAWNGSRPKCPLCKRALKRTARQAYDDAVGLPSTDSRHRRCAGCNCKLSRYNLGEVCSPCTEKTKFSD